MRNYAIINSIFRAIKKKTTNSLDTKFFACYFIEKFRDYLFIILNKKPYDMDQKYRLWATLNNERSF